MVMKNDGWYMETRLDRGFWDIFRRHGAIGEHRSVTTTYVLSESEIKTGYIYILSQWTIR